MKDRPNPEDLLEAIQKIDSKVHKGRLRVFLGMCPGVGKTYSMLKAAREQEKRGVNVAIGVVETHGRAETEELLKDLRLIPKKTLAYKGTNLYEMDLDQILKEKPALVLVDELAHTNAPGARHNKRHQDVEEILNQGIDVYTTVNIQHIDSRNDLVAQITSVLVRETVPDSFFDNADQIEVVDLSPDELLRRLKEGKVYMGDRAIRAEENFFKIEHLTALRELALRFVAERVDQDLHDQMTIKGIEGPWNTNERLLVALSHSPYSSRLIRATKRMAHNLEAPWVALYVNNGETLNLEDRKTLQKNLELARELGAEIVTIADTDLSHAIQKICKEKNVTQIVMGRPDRRFFRDLIARGTLLDQLVRTTSKIDVHVIRAERAPKYRGFHLRLPEFNTGFIPYYNTTWFLAAVSFICYALFPYIGYRALGSVFLLAILVVSSFANRGPIFFAAIVSAIIWDYIFIPPRFTFIINSWEDWMMLFSFFVTALVGGLLTKRIKRQEKILEANEHRARNLYELGKKLTEAKDIVRIKETLSDVVNREFEAQSSVVAMNKDRKLDPPNLYRVDEKDYAVALWSFENGKPAGWSTQTLSGSRCLCYPMKANSTTVGVILVYPNKKHKIFTVEQEAFLEAAVNQAAIVIEKIFLSEAAQAAKIYEASEKLHQTLINSVSHELRTPITTIIGTATALKDKKTFDDDNARESLTDELVTSAQRLDRVVENLLDVSRLEKGALKLKKEWFEAQDLVGEVKTNLKGELQGRNVTVSADSGIFIEADFKLLQHALSNLVLNATKYSSQGSPIEIELRKSSAQVFISVKDAGKGIPEGVENDVFEKFFRVPGTAAGGLGLGLAIVKNIIELHGGSVTAANRRDGQGAIFKIVLPLPPMPSALKEALG